MNTLIKAMIAGSLLSATVAAYGGAFHGWFLPNKPLKQPVSIRDGSRTGHGFYYFGRTHTGGGYSGGK